MQIALHLRQGTALAVLLLAGCGDPGTDAGGSTAVPAPAATAAPSSLVSLPSTDAPARSLVEVTIPPDDADCKAERKALEVATEVYYAQFGVYPASERALVDEDYLRAELDTYDLIPGTGEVVRVPDVPCPPDASPETTLPMTVDDVLDEIGPEGVERVGGPECARELAEIAVAGEAFSTREGRDPVSLDELDGDLDVDIVLWDYDATTDALVPAVGSPCVDFMAAGDADACEAERKTLEVAREAYLAMLGADVAEPTESDLLDQGLIRQEAEGYDLVDGAPVAVAGGPCDV